MTVSQLGGAIPMQHQQMHLQGDQSHQMHLQMQDQSGMMMGPSGVIVDPNQQRLGGVGGGASGQRYSNSQLSNQLRRHCATRVDAHGQVIIETDENLSDKDRISHLLKQWCYIR
jgi:vacuolar-type H+-ATPase subunit B/Vma2